MKKACFLLLSLFVLFLISCDGRERLFKSNSAVLKEKKLLDSFSENITYIPAKKVEIITDTILSNGYKVQVKNWTETLNSISISYIKENIKYITNFKEFIANIDIKKEDQSIFTSTINKNILIDKYEALIKEKISLSNVRFAGAFIDQEKSIKESITLSLYLDNPISETLYIYNLIVSNKGSETLQFSKQLKYEN